MRRLRAIIGGFVVTGLLGLSLTAAGPAGPAAGVAGGVSYAENVGGVAGAGFRATDGTSKTGKGQLVVIIDGAFNPTHPMFKDRVVEEACFGAYREPLDLRDSTCTANSKQWSADPAIRFESGPGTSRYNLNCVDPDGLVCHTFHGTAVTGAAAGAKTTLNLDGANVTFGGIAPGARLALLKVGKAGAWSLEGVVAALKYVRDTLSKKYPVAAVNVSASLDSREIPDASPCPESDFADVVHDLKSTNNIAVAVAAGNSGLRAGTGPWSCAPDAIAVGATNVSDLNTLADGNSPSNVSARVKLLAPVGDQKGNKAPESPWTAFAYRLPTDATYENNYNKVVGTSFASPQVAGAFAVLREKYGSGPSVDDLTRLLQRTGVNVQDTRPGATGIVIPRMWLANATGARDSRPVWDYTDDARTDLPLLAADAASLMLFPVTDDGRVNTATSVTVSTSWRGHRITVPVYDYRVPNSNGFIASVANGKTLDLRYHAYNSATKKLDTGTTIATGLPADIVGASYVTGVPIVGTGTGVIIQRSNGELELRTRIDGSDSLGPPVDVLPTDASAQTKLMSVADINQDGWPDLIVRDAATGVPRAYLGTGEPVAPFQTSPTVLTTTSYWSARTQGAIVDDWAKADGKPAPYAWYSVRPINGNQVAFPVTPAGPIGDTITVAATWADGVRLLFAARAD